MFTQTTPGSGSAVNALDFHGPRAGHLVDADARLFATEDGETWTEIDLGVGIDLYGVVSNGPGDVWLCGDDGRLVRYDGSTVESTTAGAVSLRDLTVTPDGTGLAVGGSGTVVERAGSDDWGVVSTQTGQNLRAVVGGRLAAAVGASGTVLERARGRQDPSRASELRDLGELATDILTLRDG